MWDTAKDACSSLRADVPLQDFAVEQQDSPYSTRQLLSASRITQAHQLVGAVLKYAQRTGRVAKNVALEIKRDQDLPEQAERERRYLNHTELLMLAKATDRFETLTLVLGYCGLRFGEAVALRRKHVGDRVLTVRSSATAVTGKGIVESTTKDKAGSSRAST